MALTKGLQRKIWDLQKHGINNWSVLPFNVHGEIMVPSVPEMTENIQETVKSFIRDNISDVPLLSITWKDNLANWSEK